MAKVFGIDHRLIMAPVFAMSTGVAIYSTYKLWKNKRMIKEDNLYESEKYLQEYMVFHYGSPKDVLQWDFGPQDAVDFPKRCAQVCVKYSQPDAGRKTRALDIGCAVGRHSFELARSFTEVVGIDYSQAFVDACNYLKLEGCMSYSVLLEGDIFKDLEAVIDPDIDRNRTKFLQGDACDLPLNSLGQFECVLAANLICRLHTPRRFLSDLGHLVVPGGILVITSPYSFSRDYTPRENWIGAYKKENGINLTGFDGLRSILGADFEFVAEENMSFFIRETARKNQWTVAHATIWRKK